MNPENLLLSLAVGGCVAIAAHAGRAAFHSVLDLAESDIRDRLRALRMQPQRLRTWIYVWLGVTAAVFAALLLVTQNFVVAALSAVLMLSGPWYLIRRWAQARRAKLEDQMADAMVMLSSGIRAGLSLAQALDLLAQECPSPIRQEFQQIVGEYKLGKPLERTLSEAKERLKSENFILFAAALLASRASGGRLNETVERIAKSVVELQRLERKVKSETAQARKSAVYMAVVPLVLLVVYAFIDPENTRSLFVTFPGQLMLTAAFVLNLIAYLWALRIMRPDI